MTLITDVHKKFGIRCVTLAVVLSWATASFAQIPDMLNAFDAGGRSLGLGGGLGATGTGSGSIGSNPAAIAYGTEPELTVNFRNLSESKSTMTGSFTAPDITGKGTSGNRSLTHLGYSRPLGHGASLGFAYDVGGFIKDFRTGTNLSNGSTTVVNYQELLQAKTNLFTIAYGKSNPDATSAWGLGLIIAMNNIRNFQSYSIQVGSDPPTPVTPLDNQGDTFGVGVSIGYQNSPAGSNTMFGASLRSPITMTGTSEVDGYYSRIPGRASIGIVHRMDNPRRMDDYMLLALNADYYFGGKSSDVFSRTSQFVGGGGVEYHLRQRNAYIPLRVGFRAVGRGGNGFSSFSGLSFGLGYSPDNGNYGFDLDFNTNSIGGSDMSVGLSYRIRK